MSLSTNEQRPSLRDGRQIVLDFCGRKALESVGVADSDLDVVLCHLPLETLLESQDGGVHGVLQLERLAIPATRGKMTSMGAFDAKLSRTLSSRLSHGIRSAAGTEVALSHLNRDAQLCETVKHKALELGQCAIQHNCMSCVVSL